MDALAGLAGVVLGWLLAAISDFYRRRREAHLAGRLLYAELLDNHFFARRVAELDGDIPLDAPPRRTAWEGSGATFLRIADEDLTSEIITAYAVSDAAWITLRETKVTRDEAMTRLRAFRESARSGAPSDDAAALIRATVETVQGCEASMREYAAGFAASDLPKVESALKRVERRLSKSQR